MPGVLQNLVPYDGRGEERQGADQATQAKVGKIMEVEPGVEQRCFSIHPCDILGGAEVSPPHDRMTGGQIVTDLEAISPSLLLLTAFLSLLTQPHWSG